MHHLGSRRDLGGIDIGILQIHCVVAFNFQAQLRSSQQTNVNSVVLKVVSGNQPSASTLSAHHR